VLGMDPRQGLRGDLAGRRLAATTDGVMGPGILVLFGIRASSGRCEEGVATAAEMLAGHVCALRRFSRRGAGSD
jgi:hypothetical protein